MRGFLQGTVMGPLEVIITHYATPSVTQRAMITCYSDDRKVSHAILYSEDAKPFQCEYAEIKIWAEKNTMQSNAEKF